MQRPVIIVGASVRAAAYSAIRGGYLPYAIDLFADRDLTAVCPAVRIDRYPRDFVSALAVAPVAPWIYTGGLENFPRLVDRLARARPLLGNAGHVLRAIRDPRRLAEAVRECGLPFPALARSLNETEKTAPACRWLVKPRRSGGGLAIQIASAAYLARPSRGTYLQQYIAGEAGSAVFLAANGQVMLLGASSQLLGRDFGDERPFLYAGSIAPLPLSREEPSKLTTLGSCLASRFQLTGLFNIDFIRTDDAIWPVEVNPRYSASVEVLERIFGKSFVELHITACQSGVLSAAPIATRASFVGKAIVYAPSDLVVPLAFESLVEKWNTPGRPPGIADLPSIGQSISQGQPVATVLVEESTTVQVQQELRQRATEVNRMITAPL